MREPGRSIVVGLALALVVLAVGSALDQPFASGFALLVFVISVAEGYVKAYGWPFR